MLNKIKSDKLLLCSLFILAAILVCFLYIGVTVSKYLGGALALGVVATCVALFVGILLLSMKKNKAGLILGVCVLIVCIIACVFLVKFNSLAGGIYVNKEYETVQIVALKDSGIEASDNFGKYILGYGSTDNDTYEKFSGILEENSKAVAKGKPYDNTEKLYNALKNNEIQLMVLTNNEKSDLSIIDEEYEDKIVVIFEKKYELDMIATKPVDVSKEPFTVYLQGADLSSGEDISSTGRGDVNLLLTVNPKTEQVYMQVIPRDTFVYIPCRGGSSKLSYSGWWGGVQSSIDSIEDKFDIEINYYAKINFNGLIDLVDALGGVTVYSHHTYSYQGYHFTEGYNEVDGQKALRFARARKMLPKNELSRGQHQMELIKGIFKKFAENPTYENSMAVVDSISNNFITNIPEEDYYKVFKLVVKLLPKLQEMENHSIEGEYQWHYDEVRKGYYQYYYYPKESEITRVRENIQLIKDGKTIQ